MSSLAHDLTGVMRQGLNWWTGELASLVPKKLREGAPAAGPDLVVALREGRLWLATDNRNPANSGASGGLPETALMDLISRRVRAGGKPPSVRLRLPYTACLVRRIEVPERARAEADRILALDLERATPLNAADVHTAYYRDPIGTSKGNIGIVQLIVKKSALDGAVARLEGAGVAVDGADCWSQDGTAVLPVNFLARSEPGTSPSRRDSNRTAKVLFSLAAVLLMSSLWMSLARHQNALSEIERLTAEAREHVVKFETQKGSTQAAAIEAQAVIARRAGKPPVVHIVDELTRLLPDTAYLTELSIDGDMVDISGFSKQAASLVPVLERSQMFAGASLSAPVSFDEAKDKERFSYRLRLRQPGDAGAPPAPPEIIPERPEGGAP